VLLPLQLQLLLLLLILLPSIVFRSQWMQLALSSSRPPATLVAALAAAAVTLQ
jgi:hypothetical protein